jgi:hypothetical protein
MLELNGGLRDGLTVAPNLWAGVGLVRGGLPLLAARGLWVHPAGTTASGPASIPFATATAS